jgi:surface protein
MGQMFGNARSFNQDISGWNVSNVVSMGWMFSNAISFNQDISGWDVSNVKDMRDMFYGVTLSTANYDAILNGWSEQALCNSVEFDGGNSKYSSAGEAARAKIISDFNWTITDGGME